MTWNEAKELIGQNILLDTDINTVRSSAREILSTTHQCQKYDYKNEFGFLVKIGVKEKIEIPWSMIQTCFGALSSAQGYNTDFFKENYGMQKEHQGCHVHVVGMIFVKAGIAYKDDELGLYRLI